jgi:hypothetical protein
MKITVERVMNGDDIDGFYVLYRAAFEPLRTRAAARHLLTVEEFAADMTNDRIDKIIAWSDTGAALGLSIVTTDLSAIPWIEPQYYIDRYPEHAARHTLFCLGYALVAPGGGTYGVFKALMEAAFQRCLECRGVIALDACDYNLRRAIGRLVARIPEVYGAPVTAVDTQTYYVADFGQSHPGYF